MTKAVMPYYYHYFKPWAPYGEKNLARITSLCHYDQPQTLLHLIIGLYEHWSWSTERETSPLLHAWPLIRQMNTAVFSSKVSIKLHKAHRPPSHKKVVLSSRAKTNCGLKSEAVDCDQPRFGGRASKWGWSGLTKHCWLLTFLIMQGLSAPTFSLKLLVGYKFGYLTWDEYTDLTQLQEY